ncbi:hypothetical protein E2562_022239 [Oryza meyeriana var. granulata]|uniref:Uncharacterized protein n=1 Tax=Oryza meyeriana var. granulata TaxID=110450 RepID=A0A6G1ENV3_9ORYZ|nr:hypothetical protein E2562_022239 [Oryza meyeriana var. granulata]
MAFKFFAHALVMPGTIKINVFRWERRTEITMKLRCSSTSSSNSKKNHHTPPTSKATNNNCTGMGSQEHE